MEELLSNGAFSSLTLGLAIIAVVQGIKESSKSVTGWITIVISGGIGVMAGIAGTYLGWSMYCGIDPLTGLIVGLAASGGVTLVKSIK